MNKNKLCFLCFILMFVLSACTGSEQANTHVNNENNVPLETTEQEIVEYPDENLHLVMPTFGYSEIGANEKGAYKIVKNSHEPSGYLTYYDYETMQYVHLSSQLNVTNNEENPGYISDVFGGAKPIAANGSLYVIKYGRIPLANVNHEGMPSYLLKMNENGANRQEIRLDSHILFKINSGVVSDTEELYLITEEYNLDNLITESLVLSRTNFKSNTIENLIELSHSYNSFIVGTHPKGVVLQSTFLTDGNTNIDNFTYEIDLYIPSTNELINTGFKWKQNELTFTLHNGFVYYKNTDESEIYKLDLLTNNSTIIAQVPKDAVIIGEVYDEHIILVSPNETIAVSLKDNSIKELTLYYENNGGQIPVSIISETDSSFLVQSDANYKEITLTGTDGTAYETLTNVLEYSLIDKNDYWDNIANYIKFNDTVTN